MKKIALLIVLLPGLIMTLVYAQTKQAYHISTTFHIKSGGGYDYTLLIPHLTGYISHMATRLMF